MEGIQATTCFKDYTTKNGCSIRVGYDENVAHIFSVATADGYKEIRTDNVGRELRSLPVEKFDQVAADTWVKHRDALPTLELKLGLKGGMFPAAQLSRQLARIEGLRDLAHALEEKLLQVPMIAPWSPVDKAVLGATYGSLGSTLGGQICKISMMAGKIPYVGIAAILLSPVVGWLFADYLCDADDARKSENYQIFRDVYQRFVELQIARGDRDEQRAVELVELIQKNLRDCGFIDFDREALSFKLLDEAIDAAANCYPSDSRDEAIFSIKYLILVIAASYDPSRPEVPRDALIGCLRKLIDSMPSSGHAIRVACLVQVGTLYVFSNRVPAALQVFQEIPEDSSYYPVIKGWIDQNDLRLQLRE